MFLCMVAHPSSDNHLGGVVLFVARSILHMYIFVVCDLGSLLNILVC